MAKNVVMYPKDVPLLHFATTQATVNRYNRKKKETTSCDRIVTLYLNPHEMVQIPYDPIGRKNTHYIKAMIPKVTQNNSKLTFY